MESQRPELTLETEVAAGIRLRDEAIERVKNSNTRWVDWMRLEAIKIAKCRGLVSADDLHVVAEAHDWHPEEGRAYGAVFRPVKDWHREGHVNSKRKACHRRPIAIWRYVGDE